MSKHSNDDDQMFMVHISATDTTPNNDAPFAHTLVGSIAFAIALMVFVGALKEAEHRHLHRALLQPIYPEQVR